ncbi:hypothetical protein LPJ66_006010 [Kickxella alabastrina]|uniref:Uncharacterized protein n=1 Tax=Kickxella alabastrina TaxID=61397 RepID=A0ACC1IF89_9FUNG|nr:hypothetical protein LPJ66_006010 [Kickxella alabastrina]
MTGGFLRWKNHAERLLRFNHMTMTLSAEPLRAVEPELHALHRNACDHRHSHQQFSPHSMNATATIQYTFDSTSNFPRPFLTDTPRFHSSFDPSLRHLPCILFLHGNDPGGFDVARWMAGGLSHVHQLRNPLMPSQFGTYSVYNVQDRPRVYEGHSAFDAGEPSWSRLKSGTANERTAVFASRPEFAEPMPPLGLLSISRPGYLESSPSNAPTLTAQATAIAQLVENLRVPSIHIIAHKVAAPVALEMAGLAGFRNRIRSMSLIDAQLSPQKRSQRLSERLNLLGPEWARTRAAYNALARTASDSYFRQAVAEICGTESMAEISDDPAMAQLYEGIGVFFTHWNSRKPGVLADILMWDKLDRKSWSMVKTPLLCITSTGQTYTDEGLGFDEEAQAKEDAVRAALVTTRSKPEFTRLYGSGRMLFPLARTSKMCLDFIYRHQG